MLFFERVPNERITRKPTLSVRLSASFMSENTRLIWIKFGTAIYMSAEVNISPYRSNATPALYKAQLKLTNFFRKA